MAELAAALKKRTAARGWVTRACKRLQNLGAVDIENLDVVKPLMSLTRECKR